MFPVHSFMYLMDRFDPSPEQDSDEGVRITWPIICMTRGHGVVSLHVCSVLVCVCVGIRVCVCGSACLFACPTGHTNKKPVCLYHYLDVLLVHMHMSSSWKLYKLSGLIRTHTHTGIYICLFIHLFSHFWASLTVELAICDYLMVDNKILFSQ